MASNRKSTLNIEVVTPTGAIRRFSNVAAAKAYFDRAYPVGRGSRQPATVSITN